MEQQYRFWKITDFSKELEKPLNTVDSWFKQLEKERVHYVTRKSNERVFDELDLQIGQYIIQKREEKWALEAIFNELPNVYPVRPFPPEEQPQESLSVIDREALREIFKQEIQQIVQEELSNQLQQLRLQQSELFQTLLPSAEEREKEHSELIEKVKELEHQLKEKTDYLDKRQEERDSRLMETMKTMLEARRETAAEMEAKQKRGGLFGWFRK